MNTGEENLRSGGWVLEKTAAAIMRKIMDLQSQKSFSLSLDFLKTKSLGYLGTNSNFFVT